MPKEKGSEMRQSSIQKKMGERDMAMNRAVKVTDGVAKLARPHEQ